MKITKKQARQFILTYQSLLPSHELRTKSDILVLVQRLGCIQYDPLDMAGTNPNLVLQSRVRGYQASMLEELLYTERSLVDGWDKNAAIYAVEDWPYFSRYRTRTVMRHGREVTELYAVLPRVIEELEDRGPLSSLDLEPGAKVDWFWAPASAARAALETLYTWGELVIHSRIRARRVYDLASRHIPAGILNAPDPNKTEEEYYQWHVKRRIGAIGLLWNRAGDAWLGIKGLKTPQRNAAIIALEHKGEIIPVEVEDLGYPAYIPKDQLPLLQQVAAGIKTKPRAAFIAPLDNLLWDRKLIAALFDFDYIWEVYKPVAQRKYGYYVLPVLYGDSFIARFEPRLDKKTGILEILNWWWQPGVKLTESLQRNLFRCLREFMSYLGATGLHVHSREEVNWLNGF